VSCRYTAIKDRKMIDMRPAEVDGKRFGDWEMDCIVGREGKGVILTLVERSTNFMMMRKLPQGKKAGPLSRIVVNMLLPYKRHVKTITTDNGSEFADFKYIERHIDTQVFFAHPYSSWEKGRIENINGLVRQYITKDMKLNDIDDETIKQVQYKLNRRPRKKLDFDTPKSSFFKNINNFI
jgi:IS30 family transposase